MKRSTNNTDKSTYCPPTIELVELDNEISLALESTPTPGPGEPGYTGSLTQEYFNNEPFKSNLS